jgi:3-oxoadipate enol-lactonase
MHILFGDTSLAERHEITARWREHMLTLPPSIGDAAHAVIHREAVLEELAGSPVPVLAVAATEDHAYEVALSEAIAAAAPRGRLVVVEQAGHSVALERPDVVNEHLAAHFAAAEAAAGAAS